MLLHPKKCSNPRLGTCQNCGKDIGVVLLGIHEKIYKCNRCDMNHIGGMPKSCQCGEKHDFRYVRNIGEHEKISMGICDDCKKKENDAKEMVKNGGIYFKCKICGSEGAIRPNHPLAVEVRNKLNIQKPNPCGVRLDENTCPVCSKSGI